MKAEVKAVSSPDVEVPDTASAARARDSVLLQLYVGPAGEPGHESFEVLLVTTAWLVNRLAEQEGVFGAATYFMEEIDVAAALSVLAGRIASMEGDTWEDLGRRIGSFAHWEFDDYQHGSSTATASRND
jgi:hypothetical protein